MIDYIVDNREQVYALYAAVILGIVFNRMVAKGWQGKTIRYSVGAFSLTCVVMSAEFIRGIF